MLYSEFQALLHVISCSFHTISRNFTKFWIFQPFLSQFQHVGYQNAHTSPEKFNGDAFTHFHALPHTISCNMMQFGLFQPFLANFNMLGMKMHVLKLRNSMMILSHTFTHSLTQFHAIFTQFHATFMQFQAISAIFGTISTC